MSAIDYPGLLAQLEQQRAAAVQEIADLDVIIPAVRQRAGRVVPVGLTLAPPRPVAKPTPNGGANGTPKKRPTAETRGNPHDPKWNQAHRDYAAGKPVAEIAKAAGCSVATIYTRASEGKWERPKGHDAPLVKTAAVVPQGHKLSGTVRCNHCERMTGYDPCEHCHKTLTRKW